MSVQAKTCVLRSDVLVHCSRQSCVNDLAKDRAGNWEQSVASPAVSSCFQVTLLREFDNAFRLSRLMNLSVKIRGVSVSSALRISAVTRFAPPAFALFIALMAAFTPSRVSGSMQITKSTAAGGIPAIGTGPVLFRIE